MIDRGLGVRRRAGVVLLLLATVGSLLAWQLAERARGADAAWCVRAATASAARADLVTGSGAPVLVIGDSWSVGLDLDDPADSWPTRLAGRVHVAGFSGSGFSAGASRCAGASFATRAVGSGPLGRAALVVVAGGLNDHDQSAAAITAGFTRLMARMEGTPTVVVGPASAPTRAAAVPRVDRLLAALSADAGVPYVRTSGWSLPYLPDRLHLTADGHREFGDRVAAALSRLR